ncbi:LOW QUALITY PROTEIN: failed axon connections homolog [Liolophura sinensis]|uniref:LOW QUALITY PROTEIN: failed axon connections homolog n=1 Tax=Liolophura sinensis TaxID=3198878 RepID=UPI0031598713
MAEVLSMLGYKEGGGIAILVLVLTLILCRKKQRECHPDSKTSSDMDEPLVVLYQIGRGPHAPSPSPFPVKLETFLRMAKIPYMNDHSAKFSSKGKTPWIEYRGVKIEDSQLAIDYLSRELGIDVNAKLKPEERATARAFQKMTEENLYWSMCAVTFSEDLDPLRSVLPYTGFQTVAGHKTLQRTIRKEMWGHGIGRHSPQDIWTIGKADITALSDFLGDKEFFMGDHPTEVDCTVFGMVSQMIWHMPGSPHEIFVKEKCPNLVSFCGRMKEKFWPDWESCITTGKTFNGNN